MNVSLRDVIYIIMNSIRRRRIPSFDISHLTFEITNEVSRRSTQVVQEGSLLNC